MATFPLSGRQAATRTAPTPLRRRPVNSIHTATAPGVTLLLAMVLAMVHVLGTRLPVFRFAPLFRWASFAGEVSIAYAFLEVFPELAAHQAHLMALLGLVSFYTARHPAHAPLG